MARDLKPAKAIAYEAMRVLEPDSELEAHWEVWCHQANHMLKGEPLCVDLSYAWVHQALEGIEADGPGGERMLCALKHALTAVLMAELNPYWSLLDERSDMHDHIQPTIDRASDLMDAAHRIDPFDPTIRLNVEVYERYEDEAKRRKEQGWMQSLIDHAMTGRMN